jgi:hypothetical protein
MSHCKGTTWKGFEVSGFKGSGIGIKDKGKWIKESCLLSSVFCILFSVSCFLYTEFFNPIEREGLL